MKTFVCVLVGLLILSAAAVSSAEDGKPTEAKDSVAAAESEATPENSDQLVVYYLHGNRRCVTCRKLEAYSEEAIASGFADQLTDSSIVWRVVNFEEEGNEHFAKDYELYSQSVIVSRLHDGEETEWKNLDKIWELVGNKEKFIAYVQTEVTGFLKPTEEK